MAEPDAELVARARRGDATAFETLMRRHFRMAFLVAYGQLGNRDDAEDVCQDAFVRCWERMAECRDPSRVSAWLATMVRNMAHNRRDYLALRSSELLDPDAPAAEGAGPDALLARRELREALGAALLTLPTQQREVVLLHDLEGWTHAEIAARLDMSELMSRRHLSDARKQLRALLSKAGDREVG